MTAVLDPAGVPGVPASIGAYDAWLEVNRPTGRARADLQRRLDAAAARLPQISVVMPVYDPPLEFFDRAIESVHVQIFARWQLCIADDASPDPRARARMADWAARDHRIATTNLPHNVNISAATNSAAALATGEFLAFLDQDDELEADALAEVALHLADHPDCDLLYTDDDKVDSAGRRFDPQFKPAWSPILLLGYSYTSHLLVVRRRLFQALGGFRQGFEGSQDYDFVLRAAEQARQIGHIPRILYHWRVLPGSTAQAGDAKPQAFEAGRLAVADALARRGWPGDVTHPAHARAARVGIFDIAFHHDGPSVAVIVMAGDRVAAARRCLDGLTRTAYRNFRVVVVAHGARAAEFSALAASQIDVLCSSEPGSSAGIYATANAAARAIDAEFLLFLDADIEVESDAWLSQMVGLASLPDSGAVGARVLTPDRCIVEAGIVVSNGKPAPAFQGGPGDDWGYLGYVRVSRECSAISGQCLLTRRDLFLSLGGFDQARFASAFADIDYCLRLIRAGCRNLYCAQAVVIKHDEAPGGQAPDPADRSAFRKRWGAFADLWYNVNLTAEAAQFEPARRRLVAAPGRPLRALMWGHNLNHEGAPNSQFELTIGLWRSGMIDPIMVAATDGPLRGFYEREGVNPLIASPDMLKTEDAVALTASVAALADWFQKLGADIVYANTLVSFPAILAAQRAGLPALWNCRESEPWQRYFDALDPAVRRSAYGAFGYPYRVIFVARATCDAWAPLGGRRNFTVIPNGLKNTGINRRRRIWERETARRVLGLGPRDVAAVLIGTVCERKGQIDAIEAMAALPEAARRRLRLFVVGDRDLDYSDMVHRRVAALSEAVRARLHLVPETRHVGLYQQAADIALCTSRIESYPRVILEAMAHGLPLITTLAFGIAEQVVAGQNALTYRAGDAAGLAEHMAALTIDDDRRHRMALLTNHALDSLISYDEMVRAYAALFREAYATAH